MLPIIVFSRIFSREQYFSVNVHEKAVQDGRKMTLMKEKLGFDVETRESIDKKLKLW